MQCTWKTIWKRAGIVLTVSAVSVAAVYFGGTRIQRAVTTMTSPEKEPPVIVLDAGHGGADGGLCLGKRRAGKGHQSEYLLSLRDLLRMEGYTVEVTRDSDKSIHDDGVEGIATRRVRTWITAWRCSTSMTIAVCISVHQNQFTTGVFRRTDVLFGQRKAQRHSGAVPAKCLCDPAPAGNAREIKQCGKELYLCYFSENPTVMVECGFLSNPDEAALLESEEYQQKVAFTIFSGLQQYLEEK